MQRIHLLLCNCFTFLDSSLGPDHLSALQIFWEYSGFWWAETSISIIIIRFDVFQLFIEITFCLTYYCFTFNLPKPTAPLLFFFCLDFFVAVKKGLFSYNILCSIVFSQHICGGGGPALYLKEKLMLFRFYTSCLQTLPMKHFTF